MPITIRPYLDMQFDKPKTYLVSILYDKYVSWEFCVRVLRTIFYKSREDAEAIAHEIVTNGEGFCGGYILEIAETKAEIVEELAKKEGFSLYCLVEEV
jgi:ATP-dependent Clp protease adaptor protein ClpS